MTAGIFALSKTPASNTSIAGATMAEGMSPKLHNDGVRAFASLLKRWQEDVGGALTGTFSSNVLTVTTNSTPTAYADGMFLIVVADGGNTGAATVNVDAIGSKKIRKLAAGVDVALVSGDYPDNHIGQLVYSSTSDSGTGAWILLNPASTSGLALSDIAATGALTYADWITVASATTCDIGAVASNFVLVSGTTGITGFGTVAAGAFRIVRFAAALVLTHNATSLILPNAKNITTTADSIALLKSEGSGNWRMLDFLTPATAAEFRVGTTPKDLSVSVVFDAAAEVTIAYASSVAPDFSTFFNAVISLTGNLIIANGSNLKPGQTGRFRFVQDATGSRTITFGTDYEFASGTAPTASTAANAQDLYYYDIIAAGRVLISAVKTIS